MAIITLLMMITNIDNRAYRHGNSDHVNSAEASQSHTDQNDDDHCNYNNDFDPNEYQQQQTETDFELSFPKEMPVSLRRTILREINIR